ncbi:MAG: hypothetical protein KF852_09790 [Saprospiraceae bacterium]|nr:hypothetical protein [Saprospiraceae bacterium]
MKHATLFFTLLLLVVSSCKKEELSYPDPNAGNAHVSALRNGEDWYGYLGWLPFEFTQKDTVEFVFFVTEDNIIRQTLGFYRIPLKTGQHLLSLAGRGMLLGQFSYGSFSTYLGDGDVGGEIYHTSSDTAFHFFAIDTYDLATGVVEGRFQVELIKDPLRDIFPDTPDTLRFTDGKFKGIAFKD